MQLFDADRFVKEQLDLQANACLLKPLEKPDNKVPPVNLPKLSFDKKVAAIVVGYRSVNKGCSSTSNSEISSC